jgi:hypothetical protein
VGCSSSPACLPSLRVCDPPRAGARRSGHARRGHRSLAPSRCGTTLPFIHMVVLRLATTNGPEGPLTEQFLDRAKRLAGENIGYVGWLFRTVDRQNGSSAKSEQRDSSEGAAAASSWPGLPSARKRRCNDSRLLDWRCGAASARDEGAGMIRPPRARATGSDRRSFRRRCRCCRTSPGSPAPAPASSAPPFRWQ